MASTAHGFDTVGLLFYSPLPPSGTSPTRGRVANAASAASQLNVRKGNAGLLLLGRRDEDEVNIGWALSQTMKANDTVIAAFNMAKTNRPIDKNQALIFHSDRGIQYACDEFVKAISKHPNITRSMSRKGNCWDNAVAESFFKTLKTELVYHHKYQTRQQAAVSIFEYIETFYNKKRRHQQLDNLTITEYQNLFSNNLKIIA